MKIGESMRAAVVVGLLACAGCAHIDSKTATTVRTVERRTSTAPSKGPGKLSVAPRVEGSQLEVRVSEQPLCDRFEEGHHERVTTTVRTQEGWPTWASFLTAGISGGAAAGAFVGSQSAPTSEPAGCSSSSSSNNCPITRDGWIGIGAGLAALAGTMLIVGTVDAARAMDDEDVVDVGWEREGKAVSSPCGAKRAAVGREVTVTVGSESEAATTDANGIARFGVAVGSQVPRDFVGKFWSASEMTIAVSRNGGEESKTAVASTAIGGWAEVAADRRAAISYVVAARAMRENARKDEESWARVDPSKCAEPSELNACDPVEDYLRARPSGRHADEARAALQRGAPTLARLRQDEERRLARQRAEEERQAEIEDMRRKQAEKVCRERQCKPACRQSAGGLEGRRACLERCVERDCQ